MYSELIWDFDGTLFDTYPISGANFAECILKEYGAIEDISEIIRHMKDSFGEAMAFYAGKYGFDDDFCRRFYDINDTRTPKIAKPLEGVPEILRFAVENGCRNYLYTHRNILTLNILRENGLIEYFTDFITSADNFERKPAPDALEYLAKKHSLNKDLCLMIGDREIDVLAAKNARMHGCLIPDDPSLPTCADHVIRNISELKDIITK